MGEVLRWVEATSGQVTRREHAPRQTSEPAKARGRACASTAPRAPRGGEGAPRGGEGARGRGRGCARATLQLQSMSLPAPRSGARAHPRHRTRAARDVWPAPASPSPSPAPPARPLARYARCRGNKPGLHTRPKRDIAFITVGVFKRAHARTHARACAATSPAAGRRHTIRRRHAREGAREGDGRRLVRKRAEGELRAHRGRHG